MDNYESRPQAAYNPYQIKTIDFVGPQDFEPATTHNIVIKVAHFTKRLVVMCSCNLWEEELKKEQIYNAPDLWLNQHILKLLKKPKNFTQAE